MVSHMMSMSAIPSLFAPPNTSDAHYYHDTNTSCSRWTAQIAASLASLPASSASSSSCDGNRRSDAPSISTRGAREFQSGICLGRHQYMAQLSSFFDTTKVIRQRNHEDDAPESVTAMLLSSAFPACLEHIIADYLVWPFTLNQSVDAQDTVGAWYEAKITSITPIGFMVHFEGWSTTWDECIRFDSIRLSPHHTYTLDCPVGGWLELRSSSGQWLPCQLLEKKFFRFHLRYCSPPHVPFLSPHHTHTLTHTSYTSLHSTFAPLVAASIPPTSISIPSSTATTQTPMVDNDDDYNDNDIRVHQLPVRDQIMAASPIAMITSDDYIIHVDHSHYHNDAIDGTNAVAVVSSTAGDMSLAATYAALSTAASIRMVNTADSGNPAHTHDDHAAHDAAITSDQTTTEEWISQHSARLAALGTHLPQYRSYRTLPASDMARANHLH